MSVLPARGIRAAVAMVSALAFIWCDGMAVQYAAVNFCA